jgi:hypothetical protein
MTDEVAQLNAALCDASDIAASGRPRLLLHYLRYVGLMLPGEPQWPNDIHDIASRTDAPVDVHCR